MKTIYDFLADLKDQKVKLWVEGDQLRLKAPKGVLTKRIVQQIRERKAEIVLFFSQEVPNVERQPIEITPRTEGELLPLSYAQQRLWFLEQLEGPSPIYNVPTAYRLTGGLQVTVLEQAIHEIIRRHEVLRTTFPTRGGLPVQKIAPSPPGSLAVVELQHLSETEQRAELNRRLAEAAKQPFNLAEGPLLRVTLYQLRESEQVLLLNMHHIITDGWSLGLWWEELDTLYRAFAAGKPSALPELPLQYADFAQWQRSWLTGEVLEKQLAYWQTQLAGAPTLLELPTDHARPPVQTFNGRFIHFEIAPQLAEALGLLGRRTGTTLFMTLEAAFAVLLSRYSRQEDIVIGTSIANRHYLLIEPLIGFFVNTLPLRTDLSGPSATFEQLLDRVRQVTLDAYAHQDIPFEHLVGELVEERNLSHPPLFQVMFELQDAFFAAKSLGGLSLELLEIENATAKFDMNMMLFEGQADGSLAGILEYNTDLFEQATMQRMIGHYLRLLESIAENAQQPINQLPLLTEAERQQLLVEWNDTAVPCPTDTCFHQLFEAQVARTPDAPALVYSVAWEVFTYRELNERANQVAHHLRALGVKPEVVVGVCMERCTETVISLLAIFKAGGVYIPLDPALPQERLSYMLTNSEAKVVLTKSAYVEKLSSQLDEDHIVHLNRDWEVPASSEMVARQPKTNLPNLSTPQNLAYVIYTSGSTGLPKGAMIEHQGMVNHLYTKIIDLKMSASDRLAETAPQSFDISIWQFLSALLVGGAVHIFDDETVRNPAQLLARTEAEKITILEVVPSLFRFMLDEVGALGPNRPEFCALRWLMLTGEALPPHLCREWFPYYPDIPLMNAYGPTECSDDVTHHAIYEAPPANAVTVPIGRAVPNMRLYILDPTMQPVPIGVPGELYVGGIGVGRGYLNDPERTANAFMDDPFSPPNSPPSVPPNSRGEVGGEVSDPPQNWGGLRGGSGRFYKTGDLVRYRPDGTIEFLGRLDHQVKIRGHRIELGEIEGVLAKHPAVRQSLVIAKENGPADYSLVAYVALNRSNDVSLKGPRTTEVVTTVTELRHYLSQTLPDYMIPAAFVTLDAFPLTPNGKVNRQALPEPTITSEQESYLRPQTQSEEVLANIWAEVLGVERVLRSDNFFELGGHSLLAIQVISRLRDVFQVELSVRHVFESPTVAELAQTIESARQTEQQWPVPPPIQATERTGSLPLSFAQQRLWFIDQFEGPSGTYNIPFAFRLSGKLQVPALQQAINALVQRHEVLRTTFPNHLGQPIQQIDPDLTVPLTVVDLQQTATSAQPTAQLNHLLNEEAVRPFDLASGPLLRMILYVSSQTASVLLVNIHHIIADDWSIGLLMSELDTLYQAAIHAKPVQLPALPVQYADFAQWQREWLTDSVLEPQLAYWQQQLADAPTLLNLPTDHPRPSVQTFNGQIEGFELDPALSEQLRTLSRQAGTSLFMTLYGAFAVLLSRYSGQEDLVIGTPIANRNYREVEPLIGFFLNTLPLRTDLSGNPSFADLAGQVRQHTLDAYAHQDIPFEQLVDELAIERSLSHSPLFQVAFAWLELAQPVGLGELKIDPVGLTTVTSRFDLTLLLTPSEEAGAFTGMIEYNTDLFELATIRRMIAHFQQLLTSIVADPAQSINQLPLLTERERQQLLREWNATQTPYPAKMCIHDLFSQQAERTPNAVAVTFAEQQLTYQQLNEKANQLAHHLVALGVGPEVLVGICVERSIEMVVGLLGILKAGGAYVPLDPTYPVERLAFMLSDTNVRVLLSQEKLVASLPPTPHVWCLDKDWAQIADEPVTNLEMDVRAENLAYVMYTSGSTGRPKGVSVPHRAVVRLVRETTYINFGAEEIFLQLAPISFDAATLEIWGPLLNGGQLVVMPPGPPSLAEIGTAIQRYGITTLWLTSGLFHLMVDERLEDLQPLRQLLAGGDVLSVSHVKRAVRELSNCQVHNGYGPTENTTFTCCYAVNDPPQIGHSVPIGKPIANTQVYILDERMQPVPIGVLGELYTGGAGLARGYHNRDELTAQKFVPNPYGAGRLYRTGDLARYLPDGNIQFAGRIDNQIKLRGFRIELGEIEAILSQHPAVQQTTVIAREDQPGVRSLPRNSAAQKQLVAYVVTESEGGAPLAPHASANDLRTFLKKNLPDYMVPSTFMLLESLPLNPNGKVDRRALPAPEWSGLEEEYMAPRTPTEEIVAAIWAQVLGRQRVSRDANFFDLGGHSLLATQVISRLREAFRATPHASCPTQTWGVGQQARRVALPVRTIFEAPTVAELAEAIESARQAEQQLPVPPPIQAIERVGDLPLSFAQQRLWFLAQITGPDPTYSLPMVLRLSGSLQVSALEQALGEIVRRHDILRTSFPMVEGEPVQRINPDLSLPLPVVSLQHLAEVEQTTELNRRLASEAVRPFDLAQGPLLRVGLYVLSDHSIRDGNYALFLNMHHIISDGWSLGVLWQELDSLYQAFAANQPSGLPELSVQYADFAHWQREWLQGEVLEKQLTYWQQQLANAPTLLELPTDRARNAVQTFNGQVEPFDISPQLADNLRLLSRRSGTSLFMSLYGAFSVLLGRLCGQEDLVIGTPIANRNYQQIEPLIGFFVNTLPLRADLSGNPSFLDLLGRVRQMTLDAYTHQDIPFEQLVDELAVERQLSHTPLFQVVFMWQNEALTPTKLGDLTASLTELDTVTAKFDLTLALEENQSNGAEGSGLHGAIEYNTDLFDQATIKRMIGNFKHLLTGIVADPTQSINQLPILTEGERHQLLVEWNATQAAYPQTQLVHQLVEAHAEQRPEAQAVVYPAPGPNSALTYRELNQRANQLAHYLRKLDVGPEVIVAVYMERSVDMLVGYLAILKAGGAYTPIDANYPATRVDFILSDTQTPVLLTHSKLAEKLARSHCRVICLDRDWPLVAQESQANPEHITSLDNIAYVIYTSGSTGQPKGSQISNHSLLNFIFWYQKIIEINKDDRTTQFSGLSFDVSIADIWSCLSAGATLYLPLFELLYAPSQLRDWIVTNRITKSFIVTPVAENLLGLEWPTETALEILTTGGQKLHRVPAPHHPFKLFNMYGPSECTIVTTYCLVPPNEKTNLIPPIGRPVDNTQLYIVDRHMQPVPIGVVGELYIAGDSLARGYLNRPALTAERFIPNPFSDQSGARLYRTGDLVRYLASGELEFLGRTDHQVKIRGFRIELGEIETVLAGHPHVQLATAMVYEQTPSDKRLVAYLVPARDQAPTAHTLREYLKQRIPEYMVPSAFVLLESLPLTPNGKVNRRALPAPDQMQATAHYVSPQSDLEKAIATVWQEVLGLPRVGIHDNFFDVGGHSLLAVQIQSKLQASLDTDLTITDFFAYPTIASLAEQLSSKARLDKAKIGQAQQTQPEKSSWEANQSRSQARRAALKQRVTRQPRRRKR